MLQMYYYVKKKSPVYFIDDTMSTNHPHRPLVPLHAANWQQSPVDISFTNKTRLVLSVDFSIFIFIIFQTRTIIRTVVHLNIQHVCKDLLAVSIPIFPEPGIKTCCGISAFFTLEIN